MFEDTQKRDTIKLPTVRLFPKNVFERIYADVVRFVFGFGSPILILLEKFSASSSKSLHLCLIRVGGETRMTVSLQFDTL